ncbi:MAG: glycosyltransferase [Alphaproteobacteria bacterium]|nr:glycosyltransferase [Alphaproteobacteria bacterium]
MPATPANGAFYYAPDGYDTGGERLMGRQAAGEGFLRGFVRHAGVPSLTAFARSRAEFDDFAARVGRCGWPAGRKLRYVPFTRPDQLADPGVLFYPGPELGTVAWQRRHVGQRRYSLVGVTHTTASDRSMDAVGRLLTDPVQPWDALVCTSAAVKATVARITETWGDYLRQRVGGAPRIPLDLPVIPLGVECDDFAASPVRAAARAGLRARLGIAAGDVAVLFLGRLSYHAKAHPLPMYLAAEAAAAGARVHLILAGWFANAALEAHFREAAAALAPSVPLHVLDGRNAETRRAAWAGADVFMSLSDNIQETFGLTPIEAMAAGLPAIVSDWDGYRDTVRDGIDGFRIPTFAPPPGAGADLALRHAVGSDTYDRYCGHASQMTAVDVGRTRDALTALVADPDRRRTMGEAGRRRAAEVFDWRVVVAAYQALFAELNRRRASADEAAPPLPGAPPDPLREDPFRLFAAYPTAPITATTQVAAGAEADAARFALMRRLPATALALALLASEDECRAVLDTLARRGPQPASAILDLVPANRRPILLRTLGWLAKVGLIALGPAGTIENPPSGG